MKVHVRGPEVFVSATPGVRFGMTQLLFSLAGDVAERASPAPHYKLAFHEAGHVILHCAEGRASKHSCVLTSDGTIGLATSGPPPWGGAPNDEQIVAVSKTIRSDFGLGWDFIKLLSGVVVSPDCENARLMIYHTAEYEVQRILKAEQRTLSALARELAERRYLSPEDMAAFFQRFPVTSRFDWALMGKTLYAFSLSGVPGLIQ